MALADDRSHGRQRDVDRELQRGGQILPVAELPVDFDGVPVDGAQYLAVVRSQARKAPSVVRHHAYVSPQEDARETEGHGHTANLLPSSEWQNSFLIRFKTMRHSIEQRPAPDGGSQLGVPQVANPAKWFYFIYGVSAEHQGTSGLNNPSTPTASRQPSPSLLHHFYPMQLLALLRALTLWIEEEWKPRGRSARHPLVALDEEQSRWIFAVLAHIDERLVGDDISTLRSLARCCISRIAAVRRSSMTQASFGSESAAWIVVCAVAGVWTQHDLWSEAASTLSN